ncbi:MAG: CHAT domain-containing protein [Gemmatimonadales bacterium]
MPCTHGWGWPRDSRNTGGCVRWTGSSTAPWPTREPLGIGPPRAGHRAPAPRSGGFGGGRLQGVRRGAAPLARPQCDRVSFRTALALTPGQGEDGFVTPGELAGLRLDADLVVLSACRTAGGVVVDGEGVQGLTAPLLAAGARSVVATSWQVGDQLTVPLGRAPS